MINGLEVPINTDFRACIRVIVAFEDEELAAYEKQVIMLRILYRVPPDDIGAATAQAFKFLNGGKDGEEEKDGLALRLYSFAKDASLIYSAFRQTHGIDLTSAQLHWWQFLALFMDLGADTAFSNLIGLRKRLKTGTATKEERQAAKEMGEMVDLPEPDRRTLEEKEREAEFMRLVEGHAH